MTRDASRQSTPHGSKTDDTRHLTTGDASPQQELAPEADHNSTLTVQLHKKQASLGALPCSGCLRVHVTSAMMILSQPR